MYMCLFSDSLLLMLCLRLCLWVFKFVEFFVGAFFRFFLDFGVMSYSIASASLFIKVLKLIEVLYLWLIYCV